MKIKGKNTVNVAVDIATHKEILLFKIRCNAKNCSVVIAEAIKLLKAKGFK